MLTERQKQILKVITSEYIESAQPISSSFLTEKYEFGLCSASFRIEMKNLTDLGFLEKTHVSSGRIPTDKAYRYFVNELVKDIEYESLRIKKDNDYMKMAEEVLRLVSEMSSSYIVLSFPEKKICFQAGFRRMINEPELLNNDFVFKFLNFVEDYNNMQDKIELESDLNIYIGKENPFLKQDDFSLICSEKEFNDHERIRFSLLGPKRMNYYNNIKLINSIIKSLEEI